MECNRLVSWVRQLVECIDECGSLPLLLFFPFSPSFSLSLPLSRAFSLFLIARFLVSCFSLFLSCHSSPTVMFLSLPPFFYHPVITRKAEKRMKIENDDYLDDVPGTMAMLRNHLLISANLLSASFRQKERKQK
jgi:hypothetical protein